MAEEGLNKVQLIGRLGAEPELRHTNGGQSVLGIRLATTDSYQDRDGNRKETTEWHSCSIWGKRGEALSRILKKGDRIYVEGSNKTSSYEKNGEKRYKTEVNVRNVILLGGGKGGQRETAPTGGTPDYGADLGDDDDIPFG